MEMTHAYSICNGFALLIRYNEEEDVIEYRYSDETEVKQAPIINNGGVGEPMFIIEEVGAFSLELFCKINI